MTKTTIITALLSLTLFASCKQGKYATTEKIYKAKAKEFSKTYAATPSIGQLEKVNTANKEWIASINFGTRKPNFVMIHHTAQDSLAQTIKTFQNAKLEVSAHYVIGRDGKVVQMINDLFRSHHAGAGKWGNDTDLNSSSIGIELDNNGTTDPWTDAQIDALIQVLTYLKNTYKIPQANFIGHMDFAPARKNDPSRFPWKKLAENGFGYWYGTNLEAAPENFDPKLALRIIGYDVKNTEAAIKAFKRHYIQKDINSGNLTDEDLKILYAIFKQYL